MQAVSGSRRDDHEAATLATSALLVDAVRRRIFRYVRRARRPVTRDEAAASARVSRNLAAFHLDKLVEAGLLHAGRQAATDRAGVGRKRKVYGPGPVEVHLDVPRRQHALLASVLVETLAAEEGDGRVRRTAAEAATRRGRDLGHAARAEAAGLRGLLAVEVVLDRLGFEPYEVEPSGLRLGNCPFQPLAGDAPELVCGLSHALIAGLLSGIESDTVAAVLAPRPGECCVEIRATSGAPPPPAVAPITTS